MSDSETLTEDTDVLNCKTNTNNKSTDSDFPSMGVDLLKKINFKVAFFMFLIGLFIFSDIFIEKCLPKSSLDSTNSTNSYGTVVQMTILVLAYIVIDLLSQSGVL